MKVSIVIPAYNEEQGISASIAAALAQNYPDFEVIVVNNASKDQTEAVAKKFPVKVVTENNKGLLYARERGRVEATGEIIVNMDADCLPDPDWLSKGIRHFSNANIVAATGPYDYYDGSKSFRTSSLFSQKYVYASVNGLLNMFGVGAVLIGGNNFIRAETLRSIGGYNTKILFYGEDTDTAKRVSRKGRIVFDRNIVMKTSARRFENEGTFTISFKYLFHFVRVSLFSRVEEK